MDEVSNTDSVSVKQVGRLVRHHETKPCKIDFRHTLNEGAPNKDSVRAPDSRMETQISQSCPAPPAAG